MDSGKYQLQQGASGHDDGTLIANFNDGFLQSAPDMGAAENGAPAMKFGLEAYADMLAGYPDGGFSATGLHPLDDPDGNGIPAIMEYALATSPETGAPGLPKAVGKTIAFTRETAATDVSVVIEDSTDLLEWTPRATSENGAPFLSDPGYEATQSPSGETVFSAPQAGSRFYRLHFVYP